MKILLAILNFFKKIVKYLFTRSSKTNRRVYKPGIFDKKKKLLKNDTPIFNKRVLTNPKHYASTKGCAHIRNDKLSRFLT